MTLSRSFSTIHDSYTTSSVAPYLSMPSYYTQSHIGPLSGLSANTTAYYNHTSDAMPPPTTATATAPFVENLPLALSDASLPATVATDAHLRRPPRSTTKNNKAHSASAHCAAQTQAPPTILPSTTASTLPRASSSGAWCPQDDDALLQARSRGENWAQIQLHFPSKTPNACRKRHERLVERRNASNDIDARKMALIAREYMQLRREMWRPLALRAGEKWTVVEARCMSAGLKNMQAAAWSASRRMRTESALAPLPNNALLDPGILPESDHVLGDGSGFHTVQYDSSTSRANPAGDGGVNRSVSAGSGSGSSSRRRSGTNHRRHVHTQPYARDVGGSPSSYSDFYATTEGFSQSLRALGAATVSASGIVDSHGSGAGMVSPYMSHHGQQLSSDTSANSLLHRR
ncbi:MAG: hypothetical protein SEPTF4163_005669 [Sporothrix epigloea]